MKYAHKTIRISVINIININIALLFFLKFLYNANIAAMYNNNAIK